MAGSRSEKIRPDIPTDIWCTGCIDLFGKDPILKSVDTAGFGTKLDAFLSEANSDMLFIVPEANLRQKIGADLYKREDVSVFTLKQFRSAGLFKRKTIVKVRRHEIRVLVNTLFQSAGIVEFLRNLFRFKCFANLRYQGLKPATMIILISLTLALIFYQGIITTKPEEQREPLTGMSFVRIPGGCYEMGCGSWTSRPRFIRCGYRFGAPAETRANDIGFRVVRTGARPLPGSGKGH